MNHHLLVAEFLATPWALMPERLNAVAAVLTRWSQDVPAGEDVLASIAADRNVREARRQATTAVSSGGIAVLPLYGVVTQRGNMVDDVSGPGSVSTQQFAAALRQALADDSVSQILIDIDSPGGSVLWACPNSPTRSSVPEGRRRVAMPTSWRRVLLTWKSAAQRRSSTSHQSAGSARLGVWKATSITRRRFVNIRKPT
ncbi:hypothetical protein [Candidatus Accumulibacter sp. ACC012]|uniref:hypothetical protein n=1 Tax=Candidatus Accumulibacter sp. ACC012 TaxID=2823332 RepID=UPI0025BAAB8A|nr:hypothetical protein [Candidatus Accumulibacter sp. ACC012]